MNTEEQRKEIALRRYDLISPVIKYLKSNLPHGEQSKIIRQIVKGKHPDVGCQKVGERTIERYLALYRAEGIDGLKPKMRRRAGSIPQEYYEAAKINGADENMELMTANNAAKSNHFKIKNTRFSSSGKNPTQFGLILNPKQ